MQPQPSQTAPTTGAPHQARVIREAVGVFMTVDALDHAVEDLLGEGFDLAEISVLASEPTVERKLGHRLDNTRSAEDDPTVPRRQWTAPEARTQGKGALAGMLGYVGAVAAGVVTLATGGTAAAAIALGVLAGSGAAAAGVRLANAIDKPLADWLRQQIEHGGILLWVKVGTDGQAQVAKEILARHGAADVHVHRIEMS
jgi:hypothetical protein